MQDFNKYKWKKFPVRLHYTVHCIHLAFSSHFLLTSISSPQFRVCTWAGSKLCPTAALCQPLQADVYWFLIGTDSCILRDRNITSIKNSTFCTLANTAGNLTKLLNMSMDGNKTYVSPSEEYFKWVNPLAKNKMLFSIPEKKIYTFLARFLKKNYDWMKDRIWYFFKTILCSSQAIKKVIILLQ